MSDKQLSGFPKFVYKFDRVLSLIEEISTAFVFIVMSCLVLAGVVSRFILHVPMIWTEELSRYCLVFVVFIGISLTARDMTEVPCVIIDVMRLGPGTGAPTLIAQGDIMQSIFGSHGDYPSVVLSPNSVEELYTETIRAFSLANQLSTPVTVISDAWLAHMSELIDLDIPYEIAPRKTSPQNADDYRPYFNDGTGIPAAPAFGSDKRWKSTGLIHDESGFPHPNDHELVAENIRRINKKLDDNIAIIQSWEERFTDEDYGVLVVSIGSASRCVRSAEKLREQGIKVAFFRPITLWPFPAKRFNELAANAKNIVCCEMSAGQLEFLCRANADHGTKITGLRQNNGCLLSEETIISGIKEIVLNER